MHHIFCPRHFWIVPFHMWILKFEASLEGFLIVLLDSSTLAHLRQQLRIQRPIFVAKAYHNHISMDCLITNILNEYTVLMIFLNNFLESPYTLCLFYKIVPAILRWSMFGWICLNALWCILVRRLLLNASDLSDAVSRKACLVTRQMLLSFNCNSIKLLFHFKPSFYYYKIVTIILYWNDELPLNRIANAYP